MAGQQHALAAAALLCLLGLASPVLAYRGEGTAYSGPGEKDATGRNACGFGDLGDKFETWYAAMNADQFDGSCGRCIRARGTERPASGKWHIVKVVDMCPSCSHGDVDFSTTAFEAVTGLEWDRKSIEWEWTDCNQEAADKKKKAAEKKAAEKKAAEQKRREEEKRERREAERKRAAEEEAQREAESAAAAAEAALQAQQAQQAVQGQLARPASDQTVAGTGATAGAAATRAPAGEATDTPMGGAQREGPVSDWVVPCDSGRQRCPNLGLAARGYQCTTLDGTACCRAPNGKLCKLLANYSDKAAAPEHWRGRDLTGNAGAREDSQANALTEADIGAGGSATAAPPAEGATAASPAAAVPPPAEERDTPGGAKSAPREAAATPVPAPTSRRMLQH